MQGISGMSSAGMMPKNCGMQGMPGNTQNQQTHKADNLAVKQENNPSSGIPKVIVGSKVDIRI